MCCKPPDIVISFRFPSPYNKLSSTNISSSTIKVRLCYSRISKEIRLHTSYAKASHSEKSEERLRTKRIVPLTSNGDIDVACGTNHTEDWRDEEKEGLKRLWDTKREWEKWCWLYNSDNRWECQPWPNGEEMQKSALSLKHISFSSPRYLAPCKCSASVSYSQHCALRICNLSQIWVWQDLTCRALALVFRFCEQGGISCQLRYSVASITSETYLSYYATNLCNK